MTIYARGYYLECDECGEQFDPPGGDETTDPADVERAASEAGWLVMTEGDEFHYCPDCRTDNVVDESSSSSEGT